MAFYLQAYSIKKIEDIKDKLQESVHNYILGKRIIRSIY
jgi:hypothetical protein